MRLDKTHFIKGTHTSLEEENKRSMAGKTLSEKWEIGTYLTSVAYGFGGNSLPKMKKTFTRKGKHIS
jgi:hypothetical protein